MGALPLLKAPINQDSSSVPLPFPFTWTTTLLPTWIHGCCPHTWPFPSIASVKLPHWHSRTDGSMPAGTPSTAQCTHVIKVVIKNTSSSVFTSNPSWQQHFCFPRALQPGLLHWDYMGERDRGDASWHGHLFTKNRPCSPSQFSEHQDNHHCGPPQALRAAGRTSEVFSPTGQETPT